MNILLFGNIGTAPNNFYHAGDEAMFLETYYWYQKNHPKYTLNDLTTYPNHQNLNIKEIVNPIPFEKFNLLTLVSLSVQALFFKNTKNKLISIIKNQDTIHFFGGGNITSKYHSWLYYSLSIITISKILNKKIILTSQSIGPFNLFDKIVSKYILSFADTISIRGRDMLDAAYNLSNTSTLNYPKAKDIIRIGLSLHQNFQNNIIYDNLIKLLLYLSNRHKLEIILLPHVIVNSVKEWDIGFMSKITQSLQNKLKVIIPNPNDILNSHPNPASTIKYLTSTSDLLVTSRYHGVIFALSQNVPVIAITTDKYSKQKITNSLKIIYKEKYLKYIISDKNNKTILNNKINYMINKYKFESQKIKQKNNKLLNNYDLFLNNLNQKII